MTMVAVAPSLAGHMAITEPSKGIGALTGIASFPGISYALTLSVGAAPAADTSNSEPSLQVEGMLTMSLPQSLVPVIILGVPLSWRSTWPVVSLKRVTVPPDRAYSAAL